MTGPEAEDNAHIVNGTWHSKYPAQDPTALVTEALDKAINNLKEYFNIQLAGIQKDIDEFKGGHEEKHRTVVDAAIQHRRELSEAQTNAIRTELVEMDRRYEERFNEQKTAVQAALASSTKAVQEASVSTVAQIKALSDITDSKFVTHTALLESQSEKTALALAAADKAITKSEITTEKRLDLIADQINELKASDSTRSGIGAGKTASWGYIVAAVGLIATILGVIIILANVLTGSGG